MTNTAKMFNTEALTEQFQTMFNMSGLAEAQRRNYEAFAAAGQIVAESTQAILRRQAELAQASAQEVIEASRAVVSSGTPEAGIAKHAELSKHLFENGVENLREISEMMTKSSHEAFDVINQCAAECMSDVQKKATKKK